MSYSVELAEPVVERIVGWNLSSHLHRQILKQLDELGKDPTRHLVRLPEPSGLLVHQFTARDPGPPPRDYLFSLSVSYRSDEESLVVYDCELLAVEIDPV